MLFSRPTAFDCSLHHLFSVTLGPILIPFQVTTPFDALLRLASPGRNKISDVFNIIFVLMMIYYKRYFILLSGYIFRHIHCSLLPLPLPRIKYDFVKKTFLLFLMRFYFLSVYFILFFFWENGSVKFYFVIQFLCR